jgi:protein CpxP
METDMTDMDGSNATPENAPSQLKPKRRWLRRTLIGVLLVGLGAVGGFGIGAHSASAWLWHGVGYHRLDPDRAAARIDYRVERVLSRVDATAEQKQKVSAIAKTAVSDLAALGVNPWELRSQFVTLLQADTIDPAAFETLRAEQVSKIDTGSKRIVQAMTEAAAVLTPEQRRQLTEHWNRRFWH